MANQVRLIKIIVASPSDVQAERDLVDKVAEELNRSDANALGLQLKVVRWEKDAHPGFHKKGPQGLIDPHLGIPKSDLFIGILWKRFGTPTETAQSGTEHEFQQAYQSWKRKRRPEIMVYFNQEPYTTQTPEEEEQKESVLKFRKEFPREGLSWSYKGERDFERQLRTHLTQFIKRTASRIRIRKRNQRAGYAALALFVVALAITGVISDVIPSGWMPFFSEETITPAQATDQPQDTSEASIPETPPEQVQAQPAIDPPPVAPAEDRDFLLDELIAKGLRNTLIEASGYYDLGSPSGYEQALQRFREVVGQLSPRAISMLDQALLRSAEAAYQAGHNSDALDDYRALFEKYLPKDLRE